MKTRAHAADYYRRILSTQPHALKRLDAFAKIVLCNRGQEISNHPGPAGHWYYVIAGAVRRCAVRSDGRRQILDLMLPGDCFFVLEDQNEATIEAIAGGTVLRAGVSPLPARWERERGALTGGLSMNSDKSPV